MLKLVFWVTLVEFEWGSLNRSEITYFGVPQMELDYQNRFLFWKKRKPHQRKPLRKSSVRRSPIGMIYPDQHWNPKNIFCFILEPIWQLSYRNIHLSHHADPNTWHINVNWHDHNWASLFGLCLLKWPDWSMKRKLTVKQNLYLVSSKETILVTHMLESVIVPKTESISDRVYNWIFRSLTINCS